MVSSERMGRGGGVMENEEDYLQTELSSLGIECKRRNEFNDKKELEALATAIKEVYFQDYKTAYDKDDNNYDNNQREIVDNKSHFMIWGRELVK
jgi:hypothetical protein